MLVLSRKIGEGVRIDNNIEVVVVEIKSGKVRLGFRCPTSKVILRTEIWEEEQTKKAATAQSVAAVEHCMAG